MSSSYKLTIEDIKKHSGSDDLSQIRQLNLSDLGLTSVPASVLKQLVNLEELNLSKNKLTEVEHEGVSLSHVKVLDISDNQLNNVEGLSAFPNLEKLNVANNHTLEVSDKYKLVSLSPLLKTLDGKDISLMREAVNRLDSTMSEKINEVWKEQFSNKFKQLEGDVRSKLENEFIEKLKTEVTCGPLMLKSYREYKLAILGKRHLSKAQEEHSEIQEDQPRKKKQKIVEVNGQPDETEKKGDKLNNIKTPDSKVNKKRERTTPRKTSKRKGSGPTESHFAVSHLLQTHSLNNDPTDRQTQVWGCEFEPDPERKGYTTTTCATCGGDSVCFVDCTTGRVMKKYKQPGETFYCLAWTTVTLDLGDNKKKKANIIAAGGSQNDIKIIEPTQLVCFEEIKGHQGVLESLLFHPHHPTWLLSAADDNTIMVWEVGLPKGTEYEGNSSLLLTLKARSIVRFFSIPPHGKVVLGACDDGCYLWKLFDSGTDKEDKTKDITRAHFGRVEYPGKKTVPLDSITCLSDSLVATKRVEEGCIHIWYSESEMMVNDLRLAYRLPWRQTEVPFLKFTFVPGCCVLLAGDDEGSVWMYDVEPCNMDAQTKDKQPLKQTQILSCPNETTRVFNQVSASSSLDYIVAVADTNVVCIWKRLKAEDDRASS